LNGWVDGCLDLWIIGMIGGWEDKQASNVQNPIFRESSITWAVNMAGGGKGRMPVEPAGWKLLCRKHNL
ncbi:MAG TPA: hypothetical protein VGN23_12365, partial [Verrucomicrobiae bacterium]